ncbi:hypothetical protein ACB094_11G176200 [Castanea mollissima]
MFQSKICRAHASAIYQLKVIAVSLMTKDSDHQIAGIGIDNGLLEEVTWISLGNAFQFVQSIIPLKNQVLTSDNGFACRYCLSWTKNPQYTILPIMDQEPTNTPFPQVCRPC